MSGRQDSEGPDGSGTAKTDDAILSEEVNALRREALKERFTEEENLSLIGRHGQRAKRLVPLLIVLLIVNVVLVFALPHYAIYWIIVGFFVYMYYFIVLLFPTTRRVRTPAEKMAGVKVKHKWGEGVKVVAMRGKKAVTIAFWNSFFIGTQTLAGGIALILAISIAFAILALAIGTLDNYSAALVVAQSLAIMGYYYVIVRFRPYSKDFLKSVSRLRPEKGEGKRWQPYIRRVVAVLFLLTVLAIFIISAIFIPKRTVDAVIYHLGPDLSLIAVGVVIIFISQFVLVRYIQGFDSARITTRFIESKIAFLDRDILGELDKIEMDGPGAGRSARLREVRTRFRVSRIYKVVYKDLFGILPTYPIIVDFRSILERDVADALGAEIPIDISSKKAV